MYMVWFSLVRSHFKSNLIHSTTKMQPMRQVLLIGYITKKRMAWDKMTKRGKEKNDYCAIMFTNDWWWWWCFVNCKLATYLRCSIVFFVRVVVPCVFVVFFVIAKSYDSWKWDTAYHQFKRFISQFWCSGEKKRQNTIFFAWTTSYFQVSFSFSVSWLCCVIFYVFLLEFRFRFRLPPCSLQFSFIELRMAYYDLIMCLSVDVCVCACVCEVRRLCRKII